MRHAAWPALLALLLATGCATAPRPPQTPASAPASGSAVPSGSSSPSALASTAAGVTWKDYSVRDPEPFTIALPETWQALDPTTLANAGALEQLKQQNPALAAVIEASIDQMRNGSIAFIGLDPTSNTATRPFADNVNVVPPKNRVTAAQFDLFARQSMAAVQQALKLPAAPQATDISLPGADRAIEASYTYDLATPGGTKLTIAVQQYLVLKSEKPWVLSMTTTQDQLAARGPVFREIANRFRPG